MSVYFITSITLYVGPISPCESTNVRIFTELATGRVERRRAEIEYFILVRGGVGLGERGRVRRYEK